MKVNMLRTGLLFTVVVTAPAAAATPTWQNYGLEDPAASNQSARVTWPNPQYQGQLGMMVRCSSSPRVKLWVQVDTGEDIGSQHGIDMPYRFGAGSTYGEVHGMTDTEGSIVFLGYERQQPLLEALLTPPLTLYISDTNGRAVVTSQVPTEGAEAALRNLPCTSRFFYEFDQARARAATPSANPSPPTAPVSRLSVTTPFPSRTCGDGVVQAGEACDDGNQEDNDTCSADCSRRRSVPVCGDGVVQKGEACDDHNRVSGDTCEPDCTMPVRKTNQVP
jgi:cysteine-rich repeat protein